MKLKDGHTYITRSGVKRKVTATGGYMYEFQAESIAGDGIPERYQTSGKSWMRDINSTLVSKPHPWDLVKEFKSNAK